MKRRLLTAVALLCLISVAFGCTPEDKPSAATTTTPEVTTTEATTTTEEASSSSAEVVTTTVTQQTTTAKTAQTYRTLETTHTTTTASEKPRTTTTVTTPTTVAASTVTTTSSRRTVSTQSRTTTEATTTTSATHKTYIGKVTYPITPTMSIAESSQRIHNNAVSRGKIASEVVRVTEYDPEWAFTHHPAGIVYFKGKFYTAFSRGESGEDFPGQHMAISSSEDFYNWTEPEVLVKAEQGTYGQRCIIPCGLYVAGDKMIAYYYDADYDEKWFNKNGVFNPAAAGGRKDTIYQIITTDGVNWKRQRISSTKAVGGLRQMSTGRWGSACGVWFHHTDSAIPDPNNGNTWKWYVMPEEMRAASEKRNGARLTESSWYESADGVIHLMIRSDKGYQWNAESYDGGVSFTEFYPTRVSSDNTQFNFMNLKDGRALGIGTPNEDGDIWGMWPLNLYVSEDGYNFDTVYTLRDEKYTLKQQGYSKGGQYAYMKMLEHDGYLYVFYSRMKEVMEVTRVKVSDIK